MIKVTIGSNLSRSTVIIPRSTTLRQALEDNGVEYSYGTTSLDGATLKAGDLDKTFDSFGVGDRAYLITVQKMDNAAKITVAGDAIIITSGLPAEAWRLAEQLRPALLQLADFDGDGDPDFMMVAPHQNTCSSLSKYGGVWKTARDGEKAQITLAIPCGTEDVKTYLEKTLMPTVIKVNQMENIIAHNIEDLRDQRKEFFDSVTILSD